MRFKRLQPFGVGNPQPVFSARAVRLMAPPRVMKDKHVKLKLAAAIESFSLRPEAILATPRCHPDSAALRRSDLRKLTDNRERPTDNWRKAITFDALGWHMAERFQQAGLLPGDNLDIAFTIDNNDHPEYGGLELSFVTSKATRRKRMSRRMRQRLKRRSFQFEIVRTRFK